MVRPLGWLHESEVRVGTFLGKVTFGYRSSDPKSGLKLGAIQEVCDPRFLVLGTYIFTSAGVRLVVLRPVVSPMRSTHHKTA